jgi:hypothetical protein
MSDTASPAFLALNWSANQDGRQLNPNNDNMYPEMVERFVLVVFYLSTGGNIVTTSVSTSTSTTGVDFDKCNYYW